MSIPPEKNAQDYEYMPPVVAASQRRVRRLAPLMLLVITAFFGVGLLWAGFSEIDEVTRGEGKIIPSGKNKIVSHLEGGIIKKILVKEGDTVQEGQTLILVDSTVAKARFKEGKDQYYRSLSNVERLKAQISGKDFVVPDVVLKKAPVVASQSLSAYKSWKEKVRNNQKIAEQDREQKQQELAELRANLAQYTKQHKLSQEEISLTEPLVKQGVVAKVELIRLKKELADVEGKLNIIKESIKKVQAALEQSKDKILQVMINQRSEDQKEFQSAKDQLDQAQKVFTTEEDRVTRTEVKSPVRGTVKELLVTTESGVIQPGAELISITPLEDTLLVEAQIRPSDIAFLRKGLKAMVKVSAYDFSIYGGLEATLETISADTVSDKKESASFYKIIVRTNKNYLEKGGKALPIIPGMVAVVDIITGKKTILSYLLKPILKARDTALRER